MPKITRRGFVAALPAAAAAVGGYADSRQDLVLWYRQPAANWTDALPVGNGRLGAMVFGGIATERLQLNEDTLWSGVPRDWNNPEGREYLPQVRRAVLEQEDYAKGDELSKKMQGPYNESYLPLADLSLRGQAFSLPARKRGGSPEGCPTYMTFDGVPHGPAAVCGELQHVPAGAARHQDRKPGADVAHASACRRGL